MTNKTKKTVRATLPLSIGKVLKRLHDPLAVILPRVRWCVAYSPSLRNLEGAINRNGEPATIAVDESGVNLAALEALNSNRPTAIKVRQSKYLNDVVEQDHRAITPPIKPMIGFKDFRRAGIEVMHMIRKGQIRDDGIAQHSAEKSYSIMI